MKIRLSREDVNMDFEGSKEELSVLVKELKGCIEFDHRIKCCSKCFTDEDKEFIFSDAYYFALYKHKKEVEKDENW